MDLEPLKNKEDKSRPRVLIVDDSDVIRRSMTYVLRSEFNVTSAESGNKAIEQIQEGADFDVISLDLEMPGLSGIETLKAIRNSNPDVEVLIVTGHSNLDAAKEALKLGAYDFIDKPFEKNAFRKAIHNGVERRHKSKVSEEAQKELHFVKAQLRQSEKFAELGQLIAGFVHEINSPLGSIMGLTDLYFMDEGSPEETRDIMERISSGVQLCRNITNKFLSFARKYEKKREYVEINAVVESTLELMEHNLKRDSVQVYRNLPEDMPGTTADFHEIQQVFLNIINNAHQAMKDKPGNRFLNIKGEFDKKMIRIGFEDNGPGIPEENLQKIFEPLFTTKGLGEGTGLGLSLSGEIIKEHGGNMYVASEAGNGACFAVELPIVSGTD